MTDRHRAFRPLRQPRNLTGELVARLTEEITSGNLAPNVRLPTEQQMMATFGVSRTVVREAIAVLRAEGLVKTRQGSGAFVAPDLQRRPFRIEPDGLRSIAQVLTVLALRIAVEVESAGLAAARRSKGDLRRIAKTTDAVAEAIERDEAAGDADYDFHCAIGSATGNPYFSSFLDFLGRLIIPRQTVHVDAGRSGQLKRYLQMVLTEHEAIQRAIETSDPAAARRAMRTHLTRGYERYRRLAEHDVSANPRAKNKGSKSHE